jgi:hypothetical protein
MIDTVKPVAKIRKVKKAGKRRRVTMKGLYYRHIIKGIFNNKKKNVKATDLKSNEEEEIFVKQFSIDEKHIFDNYA